MSAIPLTRIQCDRCDDTVEIPMQNVPVHTRTAGPEGWLTIVIGNDPSIPVEHLCPPCAFGFKAYMNGSSINNVGSHEEAGPTVSP